MKPTLRNGNKKTSISVKTNAKDQDVDSLHDSLASLSNEDRVTFLQEVMEDYCLDCGVEFKTARDARRHECPAVSDEDEDGSDIDLHDEDGDDDEDENEDEDNEDGEDENEDDNEGSDSDLHEEDSESDEEEGE